MPARVLVVSAEKQTQQQLWEVLHADGYDVLMAESGQSGNQVWMSDTPELVVADEALPDVSGLDFVTHIRKSETAPSHTPVIVIGNAAAVDAKVKALRAGADDYLANPIHPQELSARVRGLMARFARTSQPVRKSTLGRVHAYYGAKGGVGATTVAINTAIALHRQLHRSVALVDANLQFGDHRVFLDMGLDQRSIVDAVSAPSIDTDLLRKILVRHESGVDLLLAPPNPAAAEFVREDQHQLQRIVDLMRGMYDYVVVDLDKRLDDNTLDIVGMADRLVVVMTADLSCIKNVRLVLETMRSLAIPDKRLKLVLNRSNAFTGISMKSVEHVLQRPVAHQIGNDYRSAISSLNSGTPFMANRPDSAVGRGVLQWAKLLDQETTEAVEAGARAELVAAHA